MNDTMKTPLHELIIQDINSCQITNKDLLNYKNNLREHLSEYLEIKKTDIDIEDTIEIDLHGAVVYETLTKVFKLEIPFDIHCYDNCCSVILRFGDLK